MSGAEPSSLPVVDVATFARLYDMQAPRISWLFGAGASAAAGVPTAWQATWDWKRRIYSSEKNIRLTALDLADPQIRARIQRYFDGQSGCPPEDSDEEYSYYFERAYPHPENRRAYVEQMIAEAKPGFGHLALAALMSLGKAGSSGQPTSTGSSRTPRRRCLALRDLSSYPRWTRRRSL